VEPEVGAAATYMIMSALGTPVELWLAGRAKTLQLPLLTMRFPATDSVDKAADNLVIAAGIKLLMIPSLMAVVSTWLAEQAIVPPFMSATVPESVAQYLAECALGHHLVHPIKEHPLDLRGIVDTIVVVDGTVDVGHIGHRLLLLTTTTTVSLKVLVPHWRNLHVLGVLLHLVQGGPLTHWWCLSVHRLLLKLIAVDGFWGEGRSPDH
jgi:hypothetical protein